MTTIHIISDTPYGDNAIRRVEREQQPTGRFINVKKTIMGAILETGWAFNIIEGKHLVYEITVPNEISKGKINRFIDKKITKAMFKNGAIYDEDYTIKVDYG